MLRTEELNKNLHNRKTFDCGLSAVNAFLQESARKQAEQGVNRTWVALDEETAEQPPFPLCGYFTLTNCTVAHDQVAGSYPRYPLPALKLAWLGVHYNYQGAGVGEYLLTEAVLQAWDLYTQTQMGVALVTDPLTTKSTEFFKKYGFKGTGRGFQEGQETLYLPIKWVRDWVEQDLKIDATNHFETRDLATAWLNSPHPQLQHQTPNQMIDVPGGVDSVQQLLYSHDGV